MKPSALKLELEELLKRIERCQCSNCRKILFVKMRTLLPRILAETKQHEELLERVGSLLGWKSPDGVLQVKDLQWCKDLNIACASSPEAHG